MDSLPTIINRRRLLLTTAACVSGIGYLSVREQENNYDGDGQLEENRSGKMNENGRTVQRPDERVPVNASEPPEPHELDLPTGQIGSVAAGIRNEYEFDLGELDSASPINEVIGDQTHITLTGNGNSLSVDAIEVPAGTTDLILEGQQEDTRIIQADGADSVSPLVAHGTPENPIERFEVHNIWFDRGGETADLEYVHDGLITGCVFSRAQLDVGDGLDLDYCKYVDVIYCYSFKNRKEGIHISQYSRNCSVRNCLSHSDVTGATSHGGIGTYRASGTVIENCTVVAPVGSFGFRIVGGIDNRISVSSVVKPPVAAVGINRGASKTMIDELDAWRISDGAVYFFDDYEYPGTVIRDIKVVSEGASTILDLPVDDVTVDGGVIYGHDGDKHCCRITADNCHIEGLTVFDSGGSGIFISNGRANAILDGTLKNNDIDLRIDEDAHETRIENTTFEVLEDNGTNTRLD